MRWARGLLASMLFAILMQENEVTGQRLCSSSSLDVRKIELTTQLTSEIELNPGNDSFRLYFVATWTRDLTLYTSDIPLDGYTVHFHDFGVINNSSISNKGTMLPTTPCISDTKHVWVNNTKESNCSFSLVPQDCRQSFPDFCLCSFTNCKLRARQTCRGVQNCIDDRCYLTVPSATTSLRFLVKFNTKYQFEIKPYNRQYANHEGYREAKAEDDCIGLLSAKLSSIDRARTLCCEHGAISLLPYGINQTLAAPVFSRDQNKTLTTVTVKWFPPNAAPNPDIRELIQPSIPEKDKKIERKELANTGDAKNKGCAARPTHYYELHMFNLDPNINYRVEIIATFPNSSNAELQSKCSSTKCKATFSVNAKIPEDLCKKEYGLCSTLATCSNEYDNSTGRPATCTCGPGYYGDGLAESIGITGCEDINSCTTGGQEECAHNADCIDLSPPQVGVNCVCRQGFYGDGWRDNQGCSSERTTTLAISLTISFVFVISLIIALFLVRRRRQIVKRKRMEKFITDLYPEEGILSYYRNPDEKKEKQVWQPTFRNEWEVDRNDIEFGKVLGRGNYGIVYKGRISEQLLNKRNGRSGKFKNGEAYNPVGTEETHENMYCDIENDSIDVAIKCLQESVHSHENLISFLAEISSMINLREHRNIVKIYGCSTTENPVFMVTEYLRYGDLLHFLWDARELSKRETDSIYKVTELSLSKMAKDVAEGLSHLQQQRIIHGDIAARNVLVGENGICKLSDFGLSNDVYRYGHVKQGMREVVVPLKWTSPERMMEGGSPITSKSDVWSFGNLLYEMFTLGCPPHSEIPSAVLLDSLRQGYRMRKPNSCSDQIYDQMSKCWRWRASSRPSFTQLVKALDNIINQLQTVQKPHIDLVAAVEILDKQQYFDELESKSPTHQGTFVNGNIAVIANGHCEATDI